MIRITAAGATHTGLVRTHNEDALLLLDPLFAVADGVGGATRGEEASHLATTALATIGPEIAALESAQAAADALRAAVEQANDAIRSSQTSDPTRVGMATTLTVAVRIPTTAAHAKFVIAHVGDSRLYHVTASAIHQITHDHSVVGELVRSGRITPEDAASHPQRNVITRAIGVDPHVDVDTMTVTAMPGDSLMLCTDGLVGHVSDDEMATTIRVAATPDAAARALVDVALDRGGSDNVTVVVIGIGSDDADAVADFGTSDTNDDLGDLSSLTPPSTSVASSTVDGRAQLARARKRGRRKRIVAITIAIICAVVAFGVGFAAWEHSYFLVERSDGRIGIDKGFPIAGLSRPWRTGVITSHDLSSYDRERILGHRNLRSRDDAVRELEQLPAHMVTSR